eukprot:SAG11_NODE_33802_length_275_cov_0.852273_1_plen_25_part_01
MQKEADGAHAAAAAGPVLRVEVAPV